MAANKSFVFRFADVEVREREFTIVKTGAVLPVEPKVFRLLLYLLRHPNRVVTKEELLNAVWGDTAVTEHSLTRGLFKLRRLLDDDVREPVYIETVSTVGYRFLCPVHEVEDAQGNAGKEAQPAEGGGAAPRVGSGSIWTRAKAWRLVAGIVFVLLVAAIGWFWRQSSRERWARETAMPEVQRLIDSGNLTQAAALAVQAREVLPKDPTLEKMWIRSTGEVSIATDPPGAEVAYRPYRGDAGVWTVLGATPIRKVRVAQDDYVWRLAKSGFATQYFIAKPAGTALPGFIWPFDLTFKLHPQLQVPPEMVPVKGDEVELTYPMDTAPTATVDDFLIDRHEVTNEEYKRFVDAGGYTRREFWRQPFIEKGREIPWEQAMTRFRDSTGRPGPATWEAGSFPSGHEKYPVAGVSWYEAAAYAVFAGKSLPTAYHWMQASQADGNTPLIAAGSNFRGEGTQPVEGATALSGYGTYDMAGNVKEWCLNQDRDGNRLILGGGFGEPEYNFNFTDAQSPWDRRPNFGFRCVKLSAPPSTATTARIVVTGRDYWHEKPVPDEVFKAYAAEYSYDKLPLDSRTEETVMTEIGTRVRVSYDAAYNHERISAYLYLPTNVPPPFQAVVFFPGAMATLEDKIDLSSVSEKYDFILKSGRALIVPIYKGMYQRRDGYIPGHNPPAFLRDHYIAWAKDVGRTLDYLETRKDIDSSRTAYVGLSMGGAQGAVNLAMEKRFKAAILLSGGFHASRFLPDVDAINFVHHVTIPVLMINGRYDDDFPLESSQRPFFQFLGTPPKDKKFVLYEGGHGVFPRPMAVSECLDWLDKYLGPVPR
jgi:eukaryotic-like serine/threonine-protein kinase